MFYTDQHIAESRGVMIDLTHAERADKHVLVNIQHGSARYTFFITLDTAAQLADAFAAVVSRAAVGG
jgi:hypothetical protein